MKKLINKKFIILLTGLVIITLLIVFLYPKVQEIMEIKRLEKETKLVSDYILEDKGDINEIKEYINCDITSKRRHDVEVSLDNYLNDVIDSTNKLKKIAKDEKIKDALVVTNITNPDNLLYLNSKKEEINNLKNKFKNFINNKNIYLKENIADELVKIYDELTDKIKLDEYILNIDTLTKEIDHKAMMVDYLCKNRDYWMIGEEKIVFLKRRIKNEYEKLLEDKEELKSVLYSLVNDTKGPVITAGNLTINKGDKINLKDKFKCVDEVDDTVECVISGSYDINKVGNYTIKINASDTEKNVSNKTIKLTVQEKKVNKKPYYIEVIRNQNVVVVYGLDSNNEYTKIVKVFVCSVGLNGKTPTGTFNTSDKSSWGWLVGNVYGQYYTRITGSILFHSVPYFKKAKNELEWEEYNKLGTAASKGCVRLSVRDVKWIYDNCPSGTIVKIYDGNMPSGVVKPSAIKIDAASPNKGWDPTDPDKNNPWNK